MSVCESPKLKIEDPQLSIGSVCRGPSFYVDPGSSAILELGTKAHPYRSARAVFSEILNFHSHRDVNLTVLFKEGADVFVNDNVAYVLNITSVTLTSYSDGSATPARATLVPTRASLPTQSGKVAFSIVRNTELRLADALQRSAFTAYERQLLGGVATFRVVRSSILLANIDARREVVDYDYQAVFVFLVYLQTRWLDVRQASFNLTGLMFVSYDPLNVHLDGIVMDEYALRNGIVFRTSCNYPEASLTGSLFANNLTVITTTDRKFVDNPSALYYAGPGNFTATNMDFTGHYATANNPKGTLMVSITSDCSPNDGIPQNIEIHN